MGCSALTSAGFRTGSQLEFQIQDDCVLLSLLLQHGHRPEDGRVVNVVEIPWRRAPGM